MRMIVSCLALTVAAVAGHDSAAALVQAPSARGPALEAQEFLPNLGQIRGPARFYAVGRGSSVYFEPSSVVLHCGGRSVLDTGVVLAVDFPAAPAPPTLEGLEPCALRVNVFVGNDPGRWRQGAPAYREVRYGGVAPGADLVYRFAQRHLEYELEIAPGADLSRAVLRYRGARSLTIDPSGGLVIRTRRGTMREAPPFFYQEISGRRIAVAGGYRVLSRREFCFRAGSYDRRRPLVVDPGMIWSTFLGGSGADCTVGVATNSSGDMFVVGYSASTDYPTTPGAYQGTKKADDDVVVTKMHGDGSMVWSTYLGGSAWDAGRAVAVDANGNVYITGETLSGDFPVTSGAFHTQIGMSGTYDAFVTKLGPNGNMLAYSTYLGGRSDDKGTTIAVNSAGLATVGGVTSSTDFPTTAGVVKFSRVPGLFDGSDGFVTRLNASGSGLVYSTYVGSNSGTEQVRSLVLDGNDEPTVTGPTASPDFPTTSGAFSRTLNGIKDAFVARLTANASAYVFSTLVGGSGVEDGYGVGVDGSGNTYAVGGTTSTDFPTVPGVFQPTWGGGSNVYDGYVTAISPTGGLIYGSYLGGSGSDLAYGVAVKSDGAACVTGVCTSTNFPVTAGAVSSSFGGGAADGFVTSVAPRGTRLVYSTYIGSSGNDQACGIALRSDGAAFLVGYTDGTNFPTTPGALDRTPGGGFDGFATLLDVGLNSSTGVADVPDSRFELSGPSPNPFLSQTSGSVTLAHPAHMIIRIMDLQGRSVRRLVAARLGVGRHEWAWDGRDDRGDEVASGTYLLEVTDESNRAVRRIVRLR